MKNKILCGVVLVLSISLIVVVSFQEEANFSFAQPQDEIIQEKEEKINTIKVLNPNTTEIFTMDLEEYIIGVVAAEMPATFDLEALKAQAVAARTFAIYKQNHTKQDYDVIIGTSDQAFNNLEEMQNKWKENYETNFNKIQNAVINTKGEILTYEGQVIESFYFAMSNGYTERCELVFQEALPYIESVESSWDNESLNNYEVTKSFSKEEFCSLLNISCEQIEITDINRTSSGRIQTLKINQTEMRGVDIRRLLALRSTDFDITLGDTISITTRGSGHGVGMSQYGANGMAKEGHDYQEILKYFYQNVEISKI